MLSVTGVSLSVTLLATQVPCKDVVRIAWRKITMGKISPCWFCCRRQWPPHPQTQLPPELFQWKPVIQLGHWWGQRRNIGFTSSPLGNQSWGIASLQNPGKLLRASELAIFLFCLCYLKGYLHASRLPWIRNAWSMIIQNSPKSKVLTEPKLQLLNTQRFKETITNSVRVTWESALVSVRLFSRVTQSRVYAKAEAAAPTLFGSSRNLSK